MMIFVFAASNCSTNNLDALFGRSIGAPLTSLAADVPGEASKEA